jgi:hypothetical protein
MNGPAAAAGPSPFETAASRPPQADGETWEILPRSERCDLVEASSRFGSLIGHDLFGKPLHTFLRIMP